MRAGGVASAEARKYSDPFNQNCYAKGATLGESCLLSSTQLKSVVDSQPAVVEGMQFSSVYVARLRDWLPTYKFQQTLLFTVAIHQIEEKGCRAVFCTTMFT